MKNKVYEVAFEIAGPSALFARPDTGSAPVSYPAPTHSALVGMMESVIRMRSAYINPLRVEICAPLVFHRYMTNYAGPLMQSDKRQQQITAMVLSNVCYKVYARVDAVTAAPKGNNHLHALQDIFQRRLRRGEFYTTPFLGWREFTPTYFGELRSHTQPLTSINIDIPSMLHGVFEGPGNVAVKPSYRHDVKVREGVLLYDE